MQEIVTDLRVQSINCEKLGSVVIQPIPICREKVKIEFTFFYRYWE